MDVMRVFFVYSFPCVNPSDANVTSKCVCVFQGWKCVLQVSSSQLGLRPLHRRLLVSKPLSTPLRIAVERLAWLVLTTQRVLCSSAAQPPAPPTMHLGRWEGSSVGQVKGHVVCFLTLQLQWSCSLCGSVFKQVRYSFWCVIDRVHSVSLKTDNSGTPPQRQLAQSLANLHFLSMRKQQGFSKLCCAFLMSKNIWNFDTSLLSINVSHAPVISVSPRRPSSSLKQSEWCNFYNLLPIIMLVCLASCTQLLEYQQVMQTISLLG